MSSQSGERRGMGLTLGALVLLYLLGVGVIVIGAAAFGGDGSGSGGGASATTADVSLSEFKIGGTLQVPAGKVTLNVKNAGSMIHNLKVTELNKGTTDLSAGKSESLDLGDLKAGTYEVYCAIAGHKASGMDAKLVVAESGSAPAAAASTEHHGADVTPEEAKKLDSSMLNMMKTFGTDQAKTKGAGNQPLLPKSVDADGTKHFEITAGFTKWEVEPNKFVDAWTYNGQVPGPYLKLNVGDKVAVKVINNLTLGTDIHWHGIHTPNSFDGVSPYTQNQIDPNGGSFTYKFTADTAAIGMYHAHMHGEEAVPNGMFGVIQIGDVQLPKGRTVSGMKIPDNVTPVQEIPMVLNDAGVIGMSLNGKSFPATAPLVVNLGDWFLVHYFNEGLQNHPMHMHGFPQLIIAKDGIPLDQPYWADTILIGPGERYSVLVQARDAGVWVWHCHILNHVELPDRLFGMATAVVVQDPNAKA